jgi:hypothetical protein
MDNAPKDLRHTMLEHMAGSVHLFSDNARLHAYAYAGMHTFLTSAQRVIGITNTH